jgi:adenylate cyclase
VVEKSIQRRLAAILAADVVGYSRLMSEDETGTVSAVRWLRSEVIDPHLAEHQGRLFKAMGDGFLVEFPSVVNAVACAIAIQNAMATNKRVQLRIGINLGDVVVEGDDLLGDGVNVAARLEGIAVPGSIAISGTVRDHLGRRLNASFEDLGERQLKNIPQPVRVCLLRLGEPDVGSQLAQSQAAKPSIAVLPFNNMSSDPDQEFFADGITEDIITDLSKVSGLRVLSRNSVFALKGQALSLQQSAKRLGASYVIEGSVRRSGNKLRITTQLIEGATDAHIWAERYDRELTDVFAIQDDIAKTVVAQLKIHLFPDEREAIERLATRSVDAYTSYLKGIQAYRVRTKRSLKEAMQHFAQAIAIDPRYAAAYVGVAMCEAHQKSFHGESIRLERLLESADKALAINPTLADAYVARGISFAIVDERSKAVASFERALAVDPNSAEAHYHYGRFLASIGATEEAIEHYLKATELDPDDFEAPCFLAQAYEGLGLQQQAVQHCRVGIERAQRTLDQTPDNARPAQLTAFCWIYLGEPQRAREWIKRALEIDPDDSFIRYNAACAYAMLGEPEKALNLLEIWIRAQTQDGYLWFLNDPDFKSLRGNPRYEDLVEFAKSSISSTTSSLNS